MLKLHYILVHNNEQKFLDSFFILYYEKFNLYWMCEIN